MSDTPYIETNSPSIPANFDAYIPVRVPGAPPSDGYLNVYLPDGTGFVVNSRHLLRLDPDASGPGAFAEASSWGGPPAQRPQAVHRGAGLLTGRHTAVVALGGNALLRRGEPVDSESQARAAVAAARVVADAARRWRLTITHGNGPQVGLLALMHEVYADGDPYPLDVLDAETAGQIGYMLEMELDNRVDHQDTVAVITRVVVDDHDPAFTSPTKFVGALYDEATAKRLGHERGWVVQADGSGWRRVVPSPEPLRIVQLDAIRDLLSSGFLVVSTGGGGVPVVEDADGRHHGVEAVIDKDLASALLASGLGADLLVLATDVDAVYTGFGTRAQRAITSATPLGLRRLEFAAGSMAPKVEAACRFVERGGGRAAIGNLAQLPQLLDGTVGTQVRADGRDLDFEDGRS